MVLCRAPLHIKAVRRPVHHVDERVRVGITFPRVTNMFRFALHQPQLQVEVGLAAVHQVGLMERLAHVAVV